MSQSILRTAEYGLRNHQMNLYPKPILQNSLSMALLQVLFIVLFLGVRANKLCNMLDYYKRYLRMFYIFLVLLLQQRQYVWEHSLLCLGLFEQIFIHISNYFIKNIIKIQIYILLNIIVIYSHKIYIICYKNVFYLSMR